MNIEPSVCENNSGGAPRSVDGRSCGDCGVPPGQPHVDGCDVARCTVCGWQRISCDCPDDDGWGHIWTGEWPGLAEIREGLASDLNQLAVNCWLIWDGQRWQRDPNREVPPARVPRRSR